MRAKIKARMRSFTNRAITWLAVLIIFVILLALANRFTDGETFYGIAPTITIAVSLSGLFGLHLATAESNAWRIGPRQVAYMTVGAGLYTAIAYLFNDLLDISIGQVVLSPQICTPILFGYAFGPAVGFFTGAMGTLLGDFVTGWGVFPAWAIGNGLTGLVPGLVTIFTDERRNLPFLTTLLVLLIVVSAAAVFVHPEVPEPWTGEVEDFSFWGWGLVIGGLVMIANGHLLEQVSVALAAVNLWGTLGIIVGNGFAALAHIWINEYTLGTALIGEFAPAAATDILNLVVFTPLVLVAYNTARKHIRDE